jgi:hypothetical protein
MLAVAFPAFFQNALHFVERNAFFIYLVCSCFNLVVRSVPEKFKITATREAEIQ